MTEPEILKDEPHRPVVRIGDTVRRPVQPWTQAVHGLLRHLESVGFPSSPRVLGIDDEGREVLAPAPDRPGALPGRADLDLIAPLEPVRQGDKAVEVFGSSTAWVAAHPTGRVTSGSS